MGLTDTRTPLLRSPEHTLPQLREPPADSPRPQRQADPVIQRGPRAALVSHRLLRGSPRTHSEMRRASAPPDPPQSEGVSNRVVQKAASRPHSRMPTPNSQTNSRISTVKCLAREFPHTCPRNENSNKNQTGQLAAAALRGSQSPLGPPCQNTAVTCCANWGVGGETRAPACAGLAQPVKTSGQGD